ncbi:MAG: hypothetical protein Q9169_006948 [Polycauliona sp. 2 TL-2023]
MRLLRIFIISTLTVSNLANALAINAPRGEGNKSLAPITHSTAAISGNTHHDLLPRRLSIWTPKFEHFILAVMPIFAIPLYYELLSTIYTHILDQVLDAMAAAPESNQLVIEAGNLRWEFGCTMVERNADEDGEAIPVPLPTQFIEEYFESKRDAVERGFASVYEKSWWWEKVDDDSERERVCYAGMRVVQKGMVVVPPAGRG